MSRRASVGVVPMGDEETKQHCDLAFECSNTLGMSLASHSGSVPNPKSIRDKVAISLRVAC